MNKRTLISIVLAVSVAGIGLSGSSVMAQRKKVPAGFEIVTEYNLDQMAIEAKLIAGWSLGGVYRDCGTGSGEMMVMGNLGMALLPFYQKMAEKNKDEIMVVLQKQFPKDAKERLAKIANGKDKLTNYCQTDECQALQDEFDRLQRVISELQSGSATMADMHNIDDLIAVLEKFAQSGTVGDITAAKMAINHVQMHIQKHPETLLSDSASTTENINKLERLRKAVEDSQARIKSLGGAGCRMAYVFYKAK